MVWKRAIGMRNWLVPIMVLVLVLSIASWLLTRTSRNQVIGVATGRPNGQYFKFGNEFRDRLFKQSGREVQIHETEGSLDNRQRLVTGEVDLAIIQSGTVSLDQMAVVAPLHRDIVFVIARKDRGINSINDLQNRKVILGPALSGMRSSATHVLRHYGLLDRIIDQPGLIFDDLERAENGDIDAAIATTGLDNAALRQLLATGNYKLLGINSRALGAERSFFREFQLPAGFFSEDPKIPPDDVDTVATTALLVVRDDEPSELVKAALDALYKEDFQADFPFLISHEEAINLPPTRLHPQARRYFDPFDRVGWMTAIMESLVATKELLFALAAGLFLIWNRYRRLQSREQERQMSAEKEHLDRFVERTFAIERKQMDLTDTVELQELLNQVTRIKLEALEELTHEDLRADQSFSIFLMQCANLINKIQLKIITYSSKA